MKTHPVIVSRKVEDLIPYARNSRTHSDAQVAQIAASVREFGWTNPVLVDGESGIIAGHGRVLAARKLGMDEVPCIELAGLSDTQRRAYIIADNKLALNGGWSEDMLKIELEELGELGFDLDLIGFTDEEILALGDGELADDDEPGEPAEPKGNLSDRFMIPPFTVLNAREGWWQSRKKAWLALGIKSELGRGGGADHAIGADDIGGPQLLPRREQAAPGGSARPACDYSKKQRGNGAGRPING
jgi:ParB-like chromosome segregation protein Spo0J